MSNKSPYIWKSMHFRMDGCIEMFIGYQWVKSWGWNKMTAAFLFLLFALSVGKGWLQCLHSVCGVYIYWINTHLNLRFRQLLLWKHETPSMSQSIVVRKRELTHIYALKRAEIIILFSTECVLVLHSRVRTIPCLLYVPGKRFVVSMLSAMFQVSH